MDHLSRSMRSWNMSRIRSKDTKPEKILRSILHRRGFRFRIHSKDLPGKPDIVLRKYKTAIFIHGCFWHRHTGCKKATMPKSNIDYWTKKFMRTQERDKSAQDAIHKLGWQYFVVWECQINNERLGSDIQCFLNNRLSVNTS